MECMRSIQPIWTNCYTPTGIDLDYSSLWACFHNSSVTFGRSSKMLPVLSEIISGRMPTRSDDYAPREKRDTLIPSYAPCGSAV
jgi:hypothetical protein